ncbi:MAG: DEAD/DEAH box helicase family protein [Candidatus Muirbacterium halophilum]|nr:DEAD/DEAH box helicase family protein [Candidatus Muirbacterium halophilum]
MSYSEEKLDLVSEESLVFKKPLYYKNEKVSCGNISQLALKSGTWTFSVTSHKDSVYKLVNKSGVSFLAELKKTTTSGTYEIKGCVENINVTNPPYQGLNINGVGETGNGLRNAQLGAIHSLMAHWSLSKEVATIVLPTGTGKTETMLVATLADKAERTLVIVPSIELKNQIADKYATWGILKEIGIIPNETLNPSVLILNKTLESDENIKDIESADIIISTPAFFARATSEIQLKIKNLFSHVFFDEAHHVKANEWSYIKQLFKDSKIVQFTATPYRNDKKPIEGKIVYNYPLTKALEDECFSKISLVTVNERHPRKKDKAIADAAMQRLLDDREKGFTRHRMMVRTDERSHAEILLKDYQEWFPNERIILIHSGTKSKKTIIDNIKNGEYDIIIAVDMLKEGFDYPDFKIAAVHGMHKSLAVLLQFIGRFTRTQEGLGDASFIVNYADENISLELENLFQDGSGWEKVISEIADAKKQQAESLLTFLQGCEPYSGFDSPDIELNPKLVYPALSCVCFKSEKPNWDNFKDAFNLNIHALSQPYFNTNENVFYFTMQKREKVKWVRTTRLKDQTWALIAMHYDESSKLLFIGCSDKRFDIDLLAEKVSENTSERITGDDVFRSFDSIKRLSLVHAGIFKPANHLHRYSRLSGADVTDELTRWKEGNKVKKSDFVGVGFRDGFPVSVGASVKGKIWSPARVGDLKEWKEWCKKIGKLVTNKEIDTDQLLEDSAKKIQLEEYPKDINILATDWSEELYDRIHKLTFEIPSRDSFMLSEGTIKCNNIDGIKAEFILNIFDESISFSIILGGENGHSIIGLDNSKITVEGLKSNPIPLKQFFQENPPTMFLLNGCTIAGSIHTDYSESGILTIPNEQMKTLDWKDVDYKIESLYKGKDTRENSIQEYMMKKLINRGANIVFNDDNSGESADIVGIFKEDELIRFEMIHCKYSKEKSGARLSDLYEVCGQAVVSLRYKWKPEELLKHLERRNATGVLAGKRFYHGDTSDISEIKKALKYCNVEFEFAIAQPGVEKSSLNQEMKDFLGSIYSTVIEMTETKLRCYFNK